MTRDDILRMAREVGASAFDQTVVFTYEEAARFAALVADAERLREDAERYRWLRAESRIANAGVNAVIRTPFKKGTPFIEFPNHIRAQATDIGIQFRDNFDAAIDAARAATRARGQE
jgi:hypothetical protein